MCAKDKAKVERSVQIAQRWILARLRNETFVSLDALNARIWELLEDINARKMRVYRASRNELFYSAPHTMIGEEVEARIAATPVELYRNNERFTSQVRSNARGRHTRKAPTSSPGTTHEASASFASPAVRSHAAAEASLPL
jgi:transposase